MGIFSVTGVQTVTYWYNINCGGGVYRPFIARAEPLVPDQPVIVPMHVNEISLQK
jgi:hypothetical protein